MKQLYCKTCALLTSQGENKFCGLARYQVDPETDYCSHHAWTLPTCDICGAKMIKINIIDMVDGIAHPICDNCAAQTGTCKTCKHSRSCAFNESPSPLPKTIRQTIQKGPMQIATDVMNPERIQETCKKGCTCWDDNLGCLRQAAGTCAKAVSAYAEPPKPQ
jgi:hypothetical protein